MTESIGKAYRPWLMVSLAILLVSLAMLAVTGTVAFVNTSGGPTPLWLIVVGVVSALGLGLGFFGFFLIMVVAGWQSWKSSRKVQVIPPEHTA